MRYPDPNQDREITGMESQTKRYKKWVLWAAFLAVVVWINLYFFSSFNADQVGKLGALGDFFGGMLNPFFAFMAFVLLTQSIRLQLKEMAETRKALQETSAETRRAAEAQERVALAQEAAAKAQEQAAMTQNKLLTSQVGLEDLQKEILDSQKEYYQSALKQQTIGTMNDLFFRIFDEMRRDLEGLRYSHDSKVYEGVNAIRHLIERFFKEHESDIRKHEKESFSSSWYGFLKKNNLIGTGFFYFPRKVRLLLKLVAESAPLDEKDRQYYIRLIAYSLSKYEQRYLLFHGVWEATLMRQMNQTGFFRNTSFFQGGLYEFPCIFYERTAYGNSKKWLEIYDRVLEAKKSSEK